ncbi:hypothetical protein FNV43_RR00816 [Rhamnella rubrinervis]|uniref:TIR domain-containing protein n=1 Tax=Rhamnella rubrinervis TaxID=2594499 RepID=A0A8K0HNH4_9ROSA|nr:hypothetical protein FNV43_RR00816 [Rhamnella rubrinervis]
MSSSKVVVVEETRGREAEPTIPRQARGCSKSRAAMEATVAKVEVAVADVMERLDRVEQSVEELEGRVDDQVEELHGNMQSGHDANLKTWRQENATFQASVLETLSLIKAQTEELKHGVEETRADWVLCKRAATSGAITTQHAVSTLRVDVAKPKEFSGKRDAKELDNFMWHMERYFEGLNMHDEKQKVIIASLYFTDLGATWWCRKHEEMKKGTCIINLWEDLKHELKKQFYPVNAIHDARKKMKELKHTCSIREYVEEFSSLMLQIPNMNKEDLLFNFMDGLQSWASLELQRQGIQDISTALTIAETFMDYRQGESSNPKPRDDHDDGEEIKTPQGEDNSRKLAQNQDWKRGGNKENPPSPSKRFDIVLPGDEIPSWLTHQFRGSSSISLPLHPNWCTDKWMGFALSVCFSYKWLKYGYKLFWQIKINQEDWGFGPVYYLPSNNKVVMERRWQRTEHYLTKNWIADNHLWGGLGLKLMFHYAIGQSPSRVNQVETSKELLFCWLSWPHLEHLEMDMEAAAAALPKSPRVSVSDMNKEEAKEVPEAPEVFKERKDSKIQQIVVPIFYHVNPDDILKQTGTIWKGFQSLKEEFPDNESWRDALIQLANIAGHHVDDREQEYIELSAAVCGSDKICKWFATSSIGFHCTGISLASTLDIFLSLPQTALCGCDEYYGLLWFLSDIGIISLVDKSLLHTDHDRNILRMHKLLEVLGQNIVQESRNELRRQSRIWLRHDIDRVLNEETGPKEVQALVCPDMKLENISTLRGFSNMNKLMCNVKSIDLSGSSEFRKLENFRLFPNLEKLILDLCHHLEEIDPSITVLKRLTLLSLRSCERLKSLPTSMGGLKSFEVLNLSHCSSLGNLPEGLECLNNLEELDVIGTGQRDICPSVGDVKDLKLQSHGWKNIWNTIVGNGLSSAGLSCLEKLDLCDCGLSDGAFPDDFRGISASFISQQELNLTARDEPIDYDLLLKVKDQVRKTQNDPGIMNAFLKDILEIKLNERHLVKEVINQIRDVALEAEDVISIYVIEVTKHRRRTLLGSAFHSLGQKYLLHDPFLDENEIWTLFYQIRGTPCLDILTLKLQPLAKVEDFELQNCSTIIVSMSEVLASLESSPSLKTLKIEAFTQPDPNDTLFGFHSPDPDGLIHMHPLTFSLLGLRSEATATPPSNPQSRLPGESITYIGVTSILYILYQYISDGAFMYIGVISILYILYKYISDGTRRRDPRRTETLHPPDASSPSSSNPQDNYDVFLSFRGETGKTFTNHLYKALDQKGIFTFLDIIRLERGEDISPGLDKAIEGSRCAVVILSGNYASSHWCMDELVQILKCRNDSKIKQIVLPIFYHVNPDDILKEKGTIWKGFQSLKKEFRGNKEKVKSWSDALLQLANVAGHHLDDG